MPVGQGLPARFPIEPRRTCVDCGETKATTACFKHRPDGAYSQTCQACITRRGLETKRRQREESAGVGSR